MDIKPPQEGLDAANGFSNYTQKGVTISVVMEVALTLTILLRSIGLTLLVAVASFGPAFAATPTAPVPHGTVTLISENSALSPQGQNWLGLHIVLEPGWHTYWVNPGDAGIKPKIAWKLPAGFQAGETAWPVPQRLPVDKLIDYGYEKDVTLLVPVRAMGNAATASAAEVAAQISIAVCKELCIPGKAAVSISLPVKANAGVPAAQNAAIFAAARNRLPKMLPAASKVTVADGKGEFVLTADLGKQGGKAMFFPLEEGQVDNVAAQKAEPSPKGVRLHLKKSADLNMPIARLKGVLDLDGVAYQIDAAVMK
jgi:thiol:disulfide interchange protein DsbD